MNRGLALPRGVRALSSEAECRRRALDCWPQALGGRGSLDPGRSGDAPKLVLLPRDEEEVLACLSWARREGAALAVRGAGSGVVGGAMPAPGGVVLDCAGLVGRMTIVEGPEPAVQVSAGWKGGELERRLNVLGWALRHAPQSLEDSSVGGWLAHDGFGQLSTRYGGVRRQALRLRVAALDGVAREQPPQAHLGAEGAGGVITEATLLIRPLPRGRRFFSWAFGGAAEAADFARLLAAQAPPPSVLRAFSPLDRLVHAFGQGRSASKLKGKIERLLLSHRGFLRALSPLAGRRWTLIAIYEDEPPFGAAVPESIRLAAGAGDEPARRWWRRRFSPDAGRLRRVFEHGCFADTADLWAPYARLAAVERAVLEAARPRAFAFAHLSHFDEEGACLYVTLSGACCGGAHAEAWAAVLDACVEAGGRVNHHHGIGRAKRAWVENAASAQRRRLWKEARQAADPQRLLNPWLAW